MDPLYDSQWSPPSKRLGLLALLMYVLIIILATSCSSPTAPQDSPKRADCHYPPRFFCHA